MWIRAASPSHRALTRFEPTNPENLRALEAAGHHQARRASSFRCVYVSVIP